MRIIYGIKNTLKSIEIYLTSDEARRLDGFCLGIIKDAELSVERNFLLEAWVHNGNDDLNYCSDCALFAKYYSDKVIDNYSEDSQTIIREDP
jgi:hypothetical protein